LPDTRLHTRLERSLTHLAEKPLDAFPQALPDCHQAKATYRPLDNQRVDPDDLPTGWRRTTAQALRRQAVIHVAHDTTTLTYTSLKQAAGLGYVSDVEAARGVRCHSSLALQSNGVALGSLHRYYRARAECKRSRLQGRAIEDTEGIKWLHGLEAAAALHPVPAEERPRVVHPMGREGGIHEVFVEVLSRGHGAIIRRYRHRNVAEKPGDADEAIGQAPVAAQLRLRLPAGHGRKPRTAVVQLRSRALTLRPHPHHERGRRPLRLTRVAVREVSAPPEVEEPEHRPLRTTEAARTKKRILAVARA
jgi:hypothetical protein